MIFINISADLPGILQVSCKALIWSVPTWKVVSQNEEIVTHFNNYFNDITEGLNIKKWCISDNLSDDPLVNAIRKYENHPSIIKIKSSVETTQLFDFNFVSSDDISKITNSMDSTKKTSGAIPIKIVKLANIIQSTTTFFK